MVSQLVAFRLPASHAVALAASFLAHPQATHILFVDAEDAPEGIDGPMLISPAEGSGTTTLHELSVAPARLTSSSSSRDCESRAVAMMAAVVLPSCSRDVRSVTRLSAAFDADSAARTPRWSGPTRWWRRSRARCARWTACRT